MFRPLSVVKSEALAMTKVLAIRPLSLFLQGSLEGAGAGGEEACQAGGSEIN